MSFAEYTQDFSLDPDQTWLNVASEGPIPNKANEALQEVVRLKLSPHLLTVSKFHQVPLELKCSLARLLNVDSEDIILGNSATYGLHLLSNGLDFNAGDEIILLRNDFPTDLLPWLSLKKKGVVIHQLEAKEFVLTAQEIKAAINARTKLVCIPLIHSFTGFKSDIASIGHLCREHGILCVVNISQAAGAFGINLGQLDVDAVVCAGYKWLLGPYGTGFCWIRKQVRQGLDYPQNYWISLMDEKTLNAEGEVFLKDDHSSRRYDIFGTANFFNYAPWTASIQYLLSIGIDRVHQHNQVLIDLFVDGLDEKVFDLISPRLKQNRTNLAVFSCKDISKNAGINEYLKAKGFHLALWRNKLRMSPHIYNHEHQIQELLNTLNSYGKK